MSLLDIKQRKLRKIRRRKSIRKKISGTKEVPRLFVNKSLNYIYASIIDDTSGMTLASASTSEKDIKGKCNVEGAKVVGKMVGDRAISKDIKKVVFDRNGYIYHGKIKALADAARNAGLKF